MHGHDVRALWHIGVLLPRSFTGLPIPELLRRKVVCKLWIIRHPPSDVGFVLCAPVCLWIKPLHILICCVIRLVLDFALFKHLGKVGVALCRRQCLTSQRGISGLAGLIKDAHHALRHLATVNHVDWLIKDASATCHLDWLTADTATDGLVHRIPLLESSHVLWTFLAPDDAALLLPSLLHLGQQSLGQLHRGIVLRVVHQRHAPVLALCGQVQRLLHFPVAVHISDGHRDVVHAKVFASQNLAVVAVQVRAVDDIALKPEQPVA